MKTKLHQNGTLGAVSIKTVFIWLLALPLAVLSVSGNSPVHLPAGVSGVEIQRALDSLPATGGEVVLPAGVFNIDQPIVLRRDNQTLRGDGPGTILRLADNANCPVVIMGEPVNNPSRIIRHLKVAGFFIDGNRSHQQRELWRETGEGSEIRNNGITVQAVSDSVVENVTCARNRSGGLVTTLGVRRLLVRNFESFDNEFDGLACYLTEDSVFTGLKLHHNPGAGISLDLAFNSNVISNATLTANDLGIFMRASHENKFFGIAIRDSRSHGVFMAHVEDFTTGIARPAPNTECTQNAFTNLIAVRCGGAAFRVNDSTCTNNVIIRPRFAQNHSGGLSLALPNLVTLR